MLNKNFLPCKKSLYRQQIIIKWKRNMKPLNKSIIDLLHALPNYKYILNLEFLFVSSISVLANSSETTFGN